MNKLMTLLKSIYFKLPRFCHECGRLYVPIRSPLLTLEHKPRYFCPECLLKCFGETCCECGQKWVSFDGRYIEEGDFKGQFICDMCFWDTCDDYLRREQEAKDAEYGGDY